MKTPVFESFGCVEVSKEEYTSLLKNALLHNSDFNY